MTGRLGIATPTFGRGGSEEYVIALARWAKARGSCVTVCLPDVPAVATVARDLAHDGVLVERLAAFEDSMRVEERFFEERADMLRIVRARQLDRLVIVLPWIEYGAGAIDAAAAAGIPAAVLYQLAGRGADLGSVRAAYTWARRQRQAWATVSAQNRAVLCESLGWALDAVEVVPNALLRAVPSLSPAAASAVRDAIRCELGVPGDAPLALTVARLHYQKGVDVLLEAAALALRECSALHLAWAGDGELAAAARDEIARRGLGARVHMLGHRPDVHALLCAANAFVLPSRFEGAPFAAIEAMAAGLPVVLSDIGPHREIAGDTCGARLVPVEDAASLAEAILEVTGDPAHARHLGTAARERARAFAPGTSFERLMALLEAAAGEPAPRRPLWPLPDAEPRRRIAIYGAGEGGRRAFAERLPSVEVVAFLDTHAGGSGRTLLDRPILEPAAVAALDVDGVLLASRWYGSMLEKLDEIGYPRERVEIFPLRRL